MGGLQPGAGVVAAEHHLADVAPELATAADQTGVGGHLIEPTRLLHKLHVPAQRRRAVCMTHQ